MKILIADTFPESRRRALAEAGHAVTFEPALSGDALRGAVPDHEILVVRSTRVDAAAIDAGAPALQLIIRAGAGTNTIDKTHAAARGVRVCNVPGANALAVAELTLGLIIAVDRRLADNAADLRGGRWNKTTYAAGAFGLHGRTLGILGLGAIGVAVAARARAFGMRLSTPPNPRRSAAGASAMRELSIAETDSLDALLAAADIVSLHLPLTAQTQRLVDDTFLAHMSDHAILINTARGELVDEAALIRAMDARGIRAGLDVFQDEPAAGGGEFHSKLAAHPNVTGTHHIGASTAQAQTAVADGVIRVVDSFVAGGAGQLLHCVNADSR
ncbi:MAG: hydroxyacid dehydrogenase [Gammaproteobacteria bacterium]|nr:hydroxyacid dehydrogenase [Gammaproteobacteria bacterium]